MLTGGIETKEGRKEGRRHGDLEELFKALTV